MFRLKTVVTAVLLGTAFVSHRSFADVTEDFATDPLSGNWSFGVGDNSNSQYNWTSSASVYTGDSAGELDVHLNSSLPTARLQRSLGATYTDTDSFTLTTTFSFNLTSAPAAQDMQIAFGLVNSTTTGGNRTGTPTDFGSDNVFSTLEFNYFPNVTAFGGPTLSPAVFGAQNGGADAFGNFASNFGPGVDLGNNTNGVLFLPQDVTLQASLIYNGSSKTLSLAMNRVNSDGSLTLLATDTPDIDLVSSGYNSNFPFRVDSIAIMAYQDGFTTSGDPSLVGDVQFQQFAFTATVPEPSTLMLAGMGIIGMGWTMMRRRRP